MKHYTTSAGSRYPMGATPDLDGVNFSVFSRHATAVELLLYDAPDSATPFQIISLDPATNRTFFFWHVYVEGLEVGTHYTWRVDGPDDVRRSGRRFDKNRELLDPWARAVTTDVWNRAEARRGNVLAGSLRAVAVNDWYDWEGDSPIDRPMESSIIYELHVGGFTRHPSSSVEVSRRGSFLGLIEKIPYLKELGVTCVELLPVMAFDEQDVPEAAAYRGLRNYWGYSTHSFFCPHPGYCVTPKLGTHRTEFRDMVKALHRAGIGVILDVVFNHTAEGGSDGPVINFKGFANETFYHLDPQDRSKYLDYTGCGNTVNCNHPLVATYILNCLEYWVQEMHVDGFRFDLASVLARGEDGNPMYHAPVIWSIEFSQDLERAKIIAEAWDAAGLYQVGAFPGFRWAEWNGRYRDAVRRFVRGDKGLIGEIATRLSGSSDLYGPGGRQPINSINFVTCHDGFTLNDLISYNEKHNEANGQESHDGTNDNLSWNCGIEGKTTDPKVVRLRKRQAKNIMAILLLSRGVPMILAGDEVLRTQQGNNNAYCHDNETSWFDWDLAGANKNMLRFVREMIAFRKRHRSLMGNRFLTGTKPEGARLADITWHGRTLEEAPWSDPDAQIIAYTLAAVDPNEEDLHVMLNMSERIVDMAVPVIPGRDWFRTVDTWRASPEDIMAQADQPPVSQRVYSVYPRSVVVLEAR